MSGIPTITVTPSKAAEAYAKTDRGEEASGAGGGFGSALNRALEGAVQAAGRGCAVDEGD
jgi:hypothetical protein